MNILITGASRGIGKQIAIDLAKSGHNVIANYNKSEKDAKLMQKELKKENYEIDIYKADVSKRNDVKSMIEFVIKKHGKIDVLINNAGISQEKMFTDITDSDWNNMLQVNLTSVFYAIQETLPNMIHNKSGCIINISSIWGLVGVSCEVHYSVSKAGIDALTKSLAKELGPSNIRVNSIAPGIIDTDMNKSYTKQELDNIKEEIPLNKIGSPSCISRCINWLINDDYTTGQIISPNGGWVIT